MKKNTKSQNIQLMFNKIAKKYDLMNYIMSFVRFIFVIC